MCTITLIPKTAELLDNQYGATLKYGNVEAVAHAREPSLNG